MARSPNKQITHTALGTLCVVVGLLCLVGAVVFGLVQTVRVSAPGGPATAEAPNATGAGAACGLAITGGLCFVAAAVVESAAVRERPPGEDSSPA